MSSIDATLRHLLSPLWFCFELCSIVFTNIISLKAGLELDCYGLLCVGRSRDGEGEGQTEEG